MFSKFAFSDTSFTPKKMYKGKYYKKRKNRNWPKEKKKKKVEMC